MNSDLFWKWLLSLLRELCQKTELVPLEPILFNNDFSRFKSSSYKAFPKLTFGPHPDHMSKDDGYFDWKKQTNNEIIWTWTGDELRSSKKITTDSGEVRASESCKSKSFSLEKYKLTFIIAKSSVSISFDIGGQAIAIRGAIEFQFRCGYVGTNRWSV